MQLIGGCMTSHSWTWTYLPGLTMRFMLLIAFLVSTPCVMNAQMWLKHVVSDDVETVREVSGFDLDGDGDTDFASVAHDINEVAWWENVEGSFVKHVLATDFYWGWSLTCSDIDNDGDGDILAAGYQADQIGLWEYTPGGFVFQEVIHLNGAKGLHVTDMNMDGRLDVIGAGAQADKISVAMNFGVDNEGHPDLRPLDIATGIDGVRAVYAADLNGDEVMDIIASAGKSGSILWFEWDSGYWIEHTIIGEEYEGSRGVSSADIDLDGDMDVISAARNLDEITWWENKNDGENWVRHPLPQALGQPRAVQAIDMDFDGDIDIAANSFRDDAVYVFENLRNDNWKRRTIAQKFDGAMGFHIDDFDQDGDYDLAAAGNGANEIALWESVATDRIWVDILSHEPGQLFSDEGGSVMYNLTMGSDFGFSTDADWWAVAQIPGQDPVEIAQGEITFRPHQTIHIQDLEWVIDDVTEEADYEMTIHVGRYPDFIQGTGTLKVPVTRSIHLLPGFPNPFNAIAHVELEMPYAGRAKLDVFNILGKKVAELHNGPLEAGVQTFSFDATNLASGIYFVRADARGSIQFQKITLIK
jgi:FG-GAP-like repeat/Secretion system C-terminal sorting domain